MTPVLAPAQLRVRRISTLLARQAAAFDRLARQAAVRLTDDRVHDLRVMTRRLRSTLDVARCYTDDDSVPEARRLLRRIGRILGERRTLDVAVADYAKFTRGRTLPVLENPRIKAGEAVVHRLRPRKRAEIAALLRSASAALIEGGGSIAPILDRMATRLEVAPVDSPEKLHRLRIEGKKTRYFLEVFREMGFPPEPAAEERLKALQRVLGRIHDLQSLMELIGDEPASAIAGRQERRLRARAAPVIAAAVRAGREAVGRLQR